MFLISKQDPTRKHALPRKAEVNEECTPGDYLYEKRVS
jgi:hypothetical protein